MECYPLACPFRQLLSNDNSPVDWKQVLFKGGISKSAKRTVEALSSALAAFLADVAPDLHVDMPNLPQILSKVLQSIESTYRVNPFLPLSLKVFSMGLCRSSSEPNPKYKGFRCEAHTEFKSENEEHSLNQWLHFEHTFFPLCSIEKGRRCSLHGGL
eukprot:2341081-Amphidinium_carterae.1